MHNLFVSFVNATGILKNLGELGIGLPVWKKNCPKIGMGRGDECHSLYIPSTDTHRNTNLYINQYLPERIEAFCNEKGQCSESSHTK